MFNILKLRILFFARDFESPAKTRRLEKRFRPSLEYLEDRLAPAAVYEWVNGGTTNCSDGANWRNLDTNTTGVVPGPEDTAQWTNAG